MSLWIKICGNTSLEDARLAADAGADAAGFVFAPSPRRVTVEEVAAITPHLPDSIEKIGVFVEEDYDLIVSTVERAGLTGVQLHGSDRDLDAARLTARLRERFGSRFRILRVVHFGAEVLGQLRAAGADAHIDGVLVDSRTATALGGTGIAFDWEAARESVFDGREALRLVAAGGLTPANVAEAVTLLRPWGVDVVTGVESYPGRKDSTKVAEFARNARDAFAGLRLGAPAL